jgi:hypothetical protein
MAKQHNYFAEFKRQVVQECLAGKAVTKASDRQHEDRQVSFTNGLARGKSEASPSSHRAL